MAVVKDLVGNGIVEVLGVSRVYCKDTVLAQVLSAFQILCGNLLWYLFRLSLHFSRKLVRKTVFGQYGVHFRVVLARLSKHIHNLSDRSLAASREVLDQNGHLHSLPLFLDTLIRDFDIVVHALALYDHPGVLSGNLHQPHIRTVGSGNNLDYHTLLPLFKILLQDGHPHDIVIQRALHLSFRNEHVFSLVFFTRRLFAFLWCHPDEPVSSRGYFKHSFNLFQRMARREGANSPFGIATHSHTTAAARFLYSVNR